MPIAQDDRPLKTRILEYAKAQNGQLMRKIAAEIERIELEAVIRTLPDCALVHHYGINALSIVLRTKQHSGPFNY